jgi:hypothetical protein
VVEGKVRVPPVGYRTTWWMGLKPISGSNAKHANTRLQTYDWPSSRNLTISTNRIAPNSLGLILFQVSVSSSALNADYLMTP